MAPLLTGSLSSTNVATLLPAIDQTRLNFHRQIGLMFPVFFALALYVPHFHDSTFRHDRDNPGGFGRCGVSAAGLSFFHRLLILAIKQVHFVPIMLS
jgi:hypothetical protein